MFKTLVEERFKAIQMAAGHTKKFLWPFPLTLAKDAAFSLERFAGVANFFVRSII